MDLSEAFQHFNKTGEIDDVLIPGFAQNGEWYGIVEPKTKLFVSIDREEPIRAATIHPDRLIHTDPITREITLLGSLTSQDPDENQTFDYHHINGNVEVYATHIKFPNLKSIGNHLQVEDAWSLEIPKLESVGKSIEANRVKFFQAPRLKSVGNDLDVPQSVEFHAPELQHVGNLSTGNATIHAPKMTVQGRWAGNAKIIEKWEAHKKAAEKAIKRMKSGPDLEI